MPHIFIPGALTLSASREQREVEPGEGADTTEPACLTRGCVAAAADRKGFARQLGRAIKRPSSTSDIKGEPEADAKPPSFPPAYEDPSVPPAFVRTSQQVG